MQSCLMPPENPIPVRFDAVRADVHRVAVEPEDNPRDSPGVAAVVTVPDRVAPSPAVHSHLPVTLTDPTVLPL